LSKTGTCVGCGSRTSNYVSNGLGHGAHVCRSCSKREGYPY